MTDRRLLDMSLGHRSTIDRSLARMDELVDQAIDAFAREDAALLLAQLDIIESRARMIRDAFAEEDE